MKLCPWTAACLCCLVVGGPPAGPLSAEERMLASGPVHLRDGDPREWADFAEEPDGRQLAIAFDAEANTAEQTLRLQQRDVKQNWVVRVNDRELGRLRVDENPMVVYFTVPPDTVRDGANRLTVTQEGRKTADDIELSRIALIDAPVRETLSASHMEVAVTDAKSGEPIPCRITILDARGAMTSVWSEPQDSLAVRPGIVCTSTGHATFGLPAGEYAIYAGRGFEWGLATRRVTAAADQRLTVALSLEREVPTPGYVACDTHVHTFTHSGHGDATIEERMVTIAAEGIELPIATDHNKHIDYREMARQVGVDRYFTPLAGNEVTTPTGHFNIFPTPLAGPAPNHRRREWSATFEEIFATPGVRAVILNHARDIHSGTRPFGPKLFNAASGASLDERPFRFHAMELVNSGAVQSDPLQLYRDWFALLNRGLKITPVGGSDSHDVGRHFVGQGRTYIRCPDQDAGRIDLNQAIEAFLHGKVLVSYGLMAEVVMDGVFQSGDLVPASKRSIATCRVLGPSWTTAERFALYANGRLIREFRIDDGPRRGLKWEEELELPGFTHDVHLVGIAVGPRIRDLYWPTAKPYQPDSPEWTGNVIGSTGALWLDGDGDGKFTSPNEYAARMVMQSKGDIGGLLQALGGFDWAVAVQAAAILDTEGHNWDDPEFQRHLEAAAVSVRDGMSDYLTARRDNELARLQ